MHKLRLKSAGTLMAIILISVCGWTAIVALLLQPNIWVGSALSLAGGAAIGVVVAYLMRRWWFKGIAKAMNGEEKEGYE